MISELDWTRNSEVSGNAELNHNLALGINRLSSELLKLFETHYQRLPSPLILVLLSVNRSHYSCHRPRFPAYGALYERDKVDVAELMSPSVRLSPVDLLAGKIRNRER